MDDRIDHILSEMRRSAAEVRERFGSLTPEQLDWKPSENSWSVGQCLEHIIKTNEQFYPDFAKLAAGTRKNSFWEKWSPFTRWNGRFLIRAVTVDSKKVKAPSKDIVPPSDTASDIIDRFAEHIEEVNRKVAGCAEVDPKTTV